jgi:hypothetical protein
MSDEANTNKQSIVSVDTDSNSKPLGDLLAQQIELNEYDIDNRAQAEEEKANLEILSYRIEKLVIHLQDRDNSEPIWWKKMLSHHVPCRKSATMETLNSLKVPLDFARIALKEAEPNVTLARRVRIDLDLELLKYECRVPFQAFCIRIFSRFPANWYNGVKYSKSTSRKVITGLITSFLICLSFTLVVTAIFLIIMWLKSLSIGLVAAQSKQYELSTEIEEKKRYIENATVEINKNTKKMSNNSSLRPTDPKQENQARETTLTTSIIDIPTVMDIPKVNSQDTNIINLVADLNNEKKELEGQLIVIKDDIKKLENSLKDEKNIFKLYRNIIWVVAVGILGSIVSILSRIEEFSGKKYNDPIIPFLIGAFKPIIGGALGFLILLLVSSDFIVVKGITDVNSSATTSGGQETNAATHEGLFYRKLAFILAVSFLMGFSERLAKDLLNRAENIAGASSQSNESGTKKPE